MTPERSSLERRILSTLDAGRIPVLLGGCGSGRTSLLINLNRAVGERAAQYIDIERAASTPEGFLTAVINDSPFSHPGDARLPSARNEDARTALDQLLAFFREARSSNGEQALFLIDELLEIRSFESFPGLRGVLREMLDMLATSHNKFVLTTRYVNRAHRLFRDSLDRFEVIHVPSLSPIEIETTLLGHGIGTDEPERSDLSRMIHALTEGRPAYVHAMANALSGMEGASSGDPVSALASELAVGGHLSLVCRFSYELRLHRARGYGALKAILQILADDEPLTLTEISVRLGRTPGSTKDYLTWLEDVDLVKVRQKRYSYVDTVLRLWVRLNCRTTPPDESDLSREVQDYAVSRLPLMESIPASLPKSEEEMPTKDSTLKTIEFD